MTWRRRVRLSKQPNHTTARITAMKCVMRYASAYTTHYWNWCVAYLVHKVGLMKLMNESRTRNNYEKKRVWCAYERITNRNRINFASLCVRVFVIVYCRIHISIYLCPQSSSFSSVGHAPSLLMLKINANELVVLRASSFIEDKKQHRQMLDQRNT